MKFSIGFVVGITVSYFILKLKGVIQTPFWSSFGTLGQWVGAILTATALYMALKKDKPKLNFEVLSMPTQGGFTFLHFSGLSASYIPLTVHRFCIIHPKYTKSLLINNVLNENLPSMTKKEITRVDYGLLLEKGFKDIKDILSFCYVIDTFGNKHFVKNDFRSKLERLLRCTFGKEEKRLE